MFKEEGRLVLSRSTTKAKVKVKVRIKGKARGKGRTGIPLHLVYQLRSDHPMDGGVHCLLRAKVISGGDRLDLHVYIPTGSVAQGTAMGCRGDLERCDCTICDGE
jgi:hypothetical protein